MACCGGTVVVREENVGEQNSFATDGFKRPGKWVVIKAQIRAKFGGPLNQCARPKRGP